MSSKLLLATLLAGSLAACNTSTQSLDTGGETTGSGAKAVSNAGSGDKAAMTENPEDGADGESSDQANAEGDKVDEASPKIIRETASVSQKGTYIRALVNGEPITNYDIQRRARFRRLRRQSTADDATLRELVDQTLKLQEAERRNTIASDSQVDEAFANFARSNKSTPSRIAADLDRAGVTAAHFKEFIKSQISWQRTVGARLRAETVTTSQSDAIFELRKSGEEKPVVTEYRLQQIIFVVPAAKRSSMLSSRRQEAQNFRQRFEGCEASFELAKNLRDVAVKDLGRLLEPEVPREWREAVSDTEVGKTTEPRETDNGIEILAVCNSRSVNDDRAAQVSVQARGFDNLEETGSKASDELLAELRKNATIVYR